tara:strand:+ start:6077 stop:6862 length:786 start_codon:yes stop_codon:yes gene_type:complete
VKYTVKQLADCSGVSTRTLRFYDKISLLSPAYYAENGYRYYGEDELLCLQQILFFRELGFKLNDIKAIIVADEFDQLESLQKHKTHLLKKTSKLKNLIKTIDKTILHLKGEIEMQEHELYIGFKHPEQLEMINYLESTMGESGKKIVAQSRESTAAMNLSPEDVKKLEDEKNQWIAAITKLLSGNTSPTSQEAQDMIDEYYKKRIQRFCNPTTEEFVNLIEVEAEHPVYKEKFAAIHPDFSDFFLAAVKHYAATKLRGREK